jgi:hypothetical protein
VTLEENFGKSIPFWVFGKDFHVDQKISENCNQSINQSVDYVIKLKFRFFHLHFFGQTMQMVTKKRTEELKSDEFSTPGIETKSFHVRSD